MISTEKLENGNLTVYDGDGFLCGYIEYHFETWMYRQGSNLVVSSDDLRSIGALVDEYNVFCLDHDKLMIKKLNWIETQKSSKEAHQKRWTRAYNSFGWLPKAITENYAFSFVRIGGVGIGGVELPEWLFGNGRGGN